jgi:hypothetical protein
VAGSSGAAGERVCWPAREITRGRRELETRVAPVRAAAEASGPGELAAWCLAADEEARVWGLSQGSSARGGACAARKRGWPAAVMRAWISRAFWPEAEMERDELSAAAADGFAR